MVCLPLILYFLWFIYTVIVSYYFYFVKTFSNVVVGKQSRVPSKNATSATWKGKVMLGSSTWMMVAISFFKPQFTITKSPTFISFLKPLTPPCYQTLPNTLALGVRAIYTGGPRSALRRTTTLRAFKGPLTGPDNLKARTALPRKFIYLSFTHLSYK